jgi:hypothetical protein
VLDEIVLGLTALGEEHLLGMGDRDLVPVDLDDRLVLRCHAAHRTGERLAVVADPG